MNIHETRYLNHEGAPVTCVMVESVADDVAVYMCKGRVSDNHAAKNGTKLTEKTALNMGFRVPAGKHYRR
ncbi:hypothetical protein RCSAXON_25 [Rhodobacter phage RcSaxon]|uniref:Uncharacterized protein n=1 Tax=Rhodobacter phage RcSaxon TaxID=1698423 RepID=A0A0K1Y6J0_9CAUD|nr:hypothetical protein RCSAXON_25 [Rhodobacter phage RcSaxon]